MLILLISSHRLELSVLSVFIRKNFMFGLCRMNPKSTILITASTTPPGEFAWRIMPTEGKEDIRIAAQRSLHLLCGSKLPGKIGNISSTAQKVNSQNRKYFHSFSVILRKECPEPALRKLSGTVCTYCTHSVLVRHSLLCSSVQSSTPAKNKGQTLFQS